MEKWLADIVVKPLLRRIGTAVGSGLIVAGNLACTHYGSCGLVTDEGSRAVAAMVVGFLGIGFDLLMSAINRKAVERKVLRVGHL